MSQPEPRRVPTVLHDDGIYKFQKKLEFGQTSVGEFAQEVVEAFKVRERERLGKIRKSAFKVPKVPKGVLRAHSLKTAGEITFAPGQLFLYSTRDEHENVTQLGSFFSHAEPVYSTVKDSLKHHADYCWKVALLNAYRILDLTGDPEIVFPSFWIRLEVSQKDWNFAGLLSSASYQMGLYYAKAQAMPKAAAAIQGEKMLGANKDRGKPLGKRIMWGIEQLDDLHEGLPKEKLFEQFMEFMQGKGFAETDSSGYHIIAEDGRHLVKSKQFYRQVERYKKKKR